MYHSVPGVAPRGVRPNTLVNGGNTARYMDVERTCTLCARVSIWKTDDIYRRADDRKGWKK